MRLAAIDHGRGNVDEPEATCMVRHSIEHRVNWVDTASVMSFQQRTADIIH